MSLITLHAFKRIEKFSDVTAAVVKIVKSGAFISGEPLLGPIIESAHHNVCAYILATVSGNALYLFQLPPRNFIRASIESARVGERIVALR